MKEIQIKDNVNFSKDPYFKILMKPEEILYWSGESLKINRRGTTQKRIFILTNQRVVNVGKRGNFLTNMFSSLVKREIHVEDIAAITYSLYSNHFVLHVPSEYDYLLCCRQRNEFIERLIQLKENRQDPLMIFFFVEQINLLPFCQLEGQKETKWPKETKNVLNLQSFLQLMEKRRKTVEVSVENTEMIMSNDGQEVNEQSFEVLKVLGKGFFGNVFLVEKKDDKKLFALKVISKLDVLKKKFLDNIKNEKIILEKIKHPFVVQMEYCFASPSHIFFAMEFMQGGELYRHLKKMSKFPENTAKFYAAQILSGLSYLHSNNIMYRDMKPENILLDNKGNIALADFGISKILNPQDMTKSFVGTPEYVAPEIILQKGHNKNVDVWCFGILLYEMIFGVPPFYNKSQTIMLNWIVTIDPFFPKMIEISDQLKDLISKCLTKNPEERIGHENIDEIKSHEWFSDINWDDLEALKYDPPIKPDIKNKTDLQNFNKKYANQPAVIKKIKEQDLNYVNENKEKFKDFQNQLFINYFFLLKFYYQLQS